MLQKIISGGQTGADQAALDSAIKFNIEHGGWVPKGRKTENGILSGKYKMDEMKTGDYPARTRQNIIDSDATLIIAGGVLTGGSLLTKNLAREMGKPYCHIDFISMDDFEAAMVVHSFIIDNNVEILNIAGSRISSDPAIYEGTRTLVEAMIYMTELSSDKGIEKVELIPSDKEEMAKTIKTIDDVVSLLASKLTLKSKTKIAALNNSKIASLYFDLSDHIMDEYIFKPGSKFLFKQYIKEKDKKLQNVREFDDFKSVIHAGDFAMDIVKALKKFLEQDHVLRVVE
ncbi:MAG: putative molybdenum carrier protein [Desulfobacteraceae bacterium]|nr:putative molybdenum carrier protein [Desulfobacteraceae bacterium]